MSPDRLVFGVTVGQIDELHRTIRIIAAIGDAMQAGNTGVLADDSLSTLGEVVFDTAQDVRGICDQINGQRLEGVAATASPAVAQAERPAFSGEVLDSLLQAYSVMRLMETAAYESDGAEGLGGSCRVASDLLWKVNEYIVANYDTFAEQRSGTKAL